MNTLAADIVRANGERIGAGKGAAVMEDPQTPGSDCNSNPATDSIQQDLVSSEFVQDNVEYQWFIDYGYRDGGLHIHPSILSSLSASYSPEDLCYYDDLSRNLDANLAEIDMESFRTADIHTLLTALPVMCTDPVQHSEFNYQRERYASISGSVMEKLDIGSSISPHTSSQGEDSACSTTDTISICKSSLLFSPLKETPVLPPTGSYSVDSLDCEDMLLTCQANNKNNYTIAFEGSITMYSDGSEDFGNQDKQKADETSKVCYVKKPEVRNMSDSSMVCSDSKVYTTWSNLKHTSTNKTISRHPSGNNNTIPNFLHGNASMPTIKRSQSLPDLTQAENSHVNVPLNFSVDSAESNHQPLLHLQSSGSVMSRSVNDDTSDGGASNSSSTKKLQNLSLVKLFMKQKSMSAEGMSLTLDQSDSISDNGWPTSNSDSATNMQTQRQYATGVRARPISEKDFSINWLQRDRCSNEDMLNDEVPCNEENQRNMMSSASVEELSESTRDSDIEEIKIVDDDSRISYSEKKRPTSKTTATQAVIETEDNEVQTSIVYTLPMDGLPPVREKILNERPVYVVYPNYTLPDLSFLNVKQHQSKWENVALKPQCYNVKRGCCKRNGKYGRPFSCNDIDALRQRGFSHVKDWESLTFLLPTEYKKILHDVPELSQHINVTEETKKPLFCLSPPMRHKARTTLVDVVANNASSSSSTATQPSSGYRGSSTILSDSSTNQQVLSNNVTNPLYLYRYDSISSEASLASNEKKAQRGGSGLSKIACPNLPKRSVSLPYREREPECCNGKVPPRPPLPRSILRKNRVPATKRYSMFEMGGVEEVDDQPADSNKRMSLQEPYYMNNDLQLLCRGRIVDSEKDVDETEERCHVEVVNNSNVDCETSQHSEDDVKQLEEFLKRSGFSSQSSDGDNEDPDIKLRSYVRKFLALKMNKDMAKNIDMVESQKKTVSFAVRDKKKYVENDKRNHFNVTLNESTKDRADQNRGITVENKIDLEEKKSMISSASKAVDLLLKYWNAEATTGRQSYNDKHECAQLCLSNLCPALYAIMSDGLKPQLHSTFGPITNSVWQVVEASAQQGPLTKTLNELVQKINGEDVITEGMLKFHAFIFGLLNLRALDAWFAYLCTRESILRKHYNNDSLFIAALASANARKVVDTFLYNLNPLAFCPFQLDLLYQYRQLHSSFGNKNNHGITGFRNDSKAETATPNSRKVCPRSCGVYNDYQEKYSGVPTKADLENVLKKRFANIVGTRTLHTLEKLASEDSEDYTDSLEHSPSNRATTNKQLSHAKLPSTDVKFDEEEAISGEAKFRKLQEKWELMVGGKEDAKSQVTANTIVSPTRMLAGLGKSKIPRPLTSPVKQANLTTTNVSGCTKNAKSPVSGIPSLKKVAAVTAAATVASSVVTPSVTPHPAKAVLKKTAETRRTSRVDQEAIGTSRNHSTRPSSLPYKAYGLASKEKNLLSPHRRAASTSLPRPNTSASNLKATTGMKQTLKEVRTVMHRLPSNSGHLSFGEGERLKVILEIDNKWLLCARGDRKGLVPRMCVHSVQT